MQDDEVGDVPEYLKKVVIRETKFITSHALIINIGIITLFRTILVSIFRSKFPNLSKIQKPRTTNVA